MKKEKTGSSKTEDLLEPGKFYILNNQFDEALTFFLKKKEEDENNPEIYYHLGLIYETKHDISAAKTMFEKTLSINPNHKLAKKHLNNLVGI